MKIVSLVLVALVVMAHWEPLLAQENRKARDFLRKPLTEQQKKKLYNQALYKFHFQKPLARGERKALANHWYLKVKNSTSQFRHSRHRKRNGWQKKWMNK